MTTSENKEYKESILFLKATNTLFWTPFIGATLILLFVVVFITDYNLQLSDKVIGNRIAERGKSTILMYEAISLGKIHFDENVDEQSLIQSLGNQKDFVFLAITDSKGKVLIHSNVQKSNENISIHNAENPGQAFIERIKELLPNSDGDGTNWGFVEVNNTRLFLVHRIFGQKLKHDAGIFQKQNKEDMLKNEKMKHVFVAIQPTTLQNALTSHRKNIFVMALAVIGVSSIVLWIFSLMHRIIGNRKRMAVAESTITSMREEVQRLESEIQKQEKIVAIGNLAAAVAHEIRNPLSSIKGYATYFASLFPPQSDNQKAAQIMIAEVERLNRVIGDLIGVSRPTDIKRKEISIRSIIDNTSQLLSQDTKQLGIELEVHGTDQIVSIDPDRFKQAFINIVLNAIEALKEQDSKQQKNPAKIDIILSQNKKNVLIEINDNGPGMSEKTLRCIFDPYFTTKSQGTGLGLVNSNKIIEAHGGSISVKSKENVGTTFTIQIPKNL